MSSPLEYYWDGDPKKSLGFVFLFQRPKRGQTLFGAVAAIVSKTVGSSS